MKDRDELLLDGVTVGNVSVSSASVSTHLEIVLRCPLFTQQCILSDYYVLSLPAVLFTAMESTADFKHKYVVKHRSAKLVMT